MYFDIELHIYDKNNVEFYSSLLSTEVSITYNHFIKLITLLYIYKY